MDRSALGEKNSNNARYDLNSFDCIVFKKSIFKVAKKICDRNSCWAFEPLQRPLQPQPQQQQQQQQQPEQQQRRHHRGVTSGSNQKFRPQEKLKVS